MAAAASCIETAAPRRTTKVAVKVEQSIINGLLARSSKRESCGCVACSPGRTIVDVLAELLDDPDEVEAWRADYAACVATFKRVHDIGDDILEQYSQRGYAMVEVEVKEDDDDKEQGRYIVSADAI